tara:strand:+ start:2679 stop:3566 length:888 start_codon:yes stop_codon:yes gene_type:complete
MKITNKYNLPSPVVSALSFDSYSKGESDMSITQLIDAPRISVLRRKHDEQMTEDISSKLWSVLGTAVHSMFENAVHESQMISEKRFFCQHDSSWTISGAIDLIEINGDQITVTDYKCTSVWSVIFEKQEWHNQLNAYAWLLRHCTEPVQGNVSKLRIIAVLRDWKENDLKRNGGNYPKAPIAIIDIPLWSIEEQDRYMKERIDLFDQAAFASLTGQPLPKCSDKEQWAKPAKFAVHKGSNKRATKVFDTQEEASAFVLEKGKEFNIQNRPGDKTRCNANWCGVNEWCEQYAEEQA